MPTFKHTYIDTDNPVNKRHWTGMGQIGDSFDSVTWHDGLEEDKDYQVQMWIDVNENGRLDSQGRLFRNSYTDEDGKVILSDYYTG